MCIRDRYLYGSPEEEEVKRQLSVCIRAAEVLHSMNSLKMAAIGHTPQGFGFGRALDLELLKVFGVTLESIEARELIGMAKSYKEEECLPYLEEASRRCLLYTSYTIRFCSLYLFTHHIFFPL